MNAKEFKLAGEKKTFQAQIIDDGFKHSLMVYQDVATQGFRLHAAVWDGELRLCPVWTAFGTSLLLIPKPNSRHCRYHHTDKVRFAVTHQSASPTWLRRKTRHRVWLKDIQLYVFCKEYRQQNQRKGEAGAFEINFVSEDGAAHFHEAFYSTPSEPSTGSPEAIEDTK
ncbi:hypothetical protein ColLi_11686 [Colletotrichum liriopes]|uniref:PH domain-containing protein n=1 Tax=Colletotrichum liriopes TaxID=708192 RepID=A0AA37GWY1_9PEZI|nr:hypothetical protein ColLi_11686 [Colletotrichum liriopes]